MAALGRFLRPSFVEADVDKARAEVEGRGMDPRVGVRWDGLGRAETVARRRLRGKAMTGVEVTN